MVNSTGPDHQGPAVLFRMIRVYCRTFRLRKYKNKNTMQIMKHKVFDRILEFETRLYTTRTIDTVEKTHTLKSYFAQNIIVRLKKQATLTRTPFKQNKI